MYLFMILCGCAAAEPPAPAPPADAQAAEAQEDPAGAMAAQEVTVECDRVRVVVPAGWEPRVATLPGGERGVRVGSVTFRTREDPPDVRFTGRDFSVVAEGIVKVIRPRGPLVTEEGPFRTLIWRNGRMVSR